MHVFFHDYSMSFFFAMFIYSFTVYISPATALLLLALPAVVLLLRGLEPNQEHQVWVCKMVPCEQSLLRSSW